LWFTFELPAVRKVMRPIYREMGILPTQETPALEDRAAAQ
jgi:hypothetical protein